MSIERNTCRICGNNELVNVLDLGTQHLTGIFPKAITDNPGVGPLVLSKCHGESDNDICGLVQLKHSFPLDKMYGDNYGYRSSLNPSMVHHLLETVEILRNIATVNKNDLIVDIGSNDATLLKMFPSDQFRLIGIDPSGNKFIDSYPKHVQLIPEVFSLASLKKEIGSKKAKLVTSIAMFYDLESPLVMMKEINELLANDGIWLFEQSYLPSMLLNNSYDTICHEHLEYYCLRQLKWMTDLAGLKIIDIRFNEINGGSISIVAAKKNAPYVECESIIQRILERENFERMSSIETYARFQNRVIHHKDTLLNTLNKLSNEGNIVFGYGASTKGNVILQYCGLTSSELPFIAEINEDKFGCYTPGSHIPIISERDAKDLAPNGFVVFPWHFKNNIVAKEQNYLGSGGKLIFPLPDVHIL